MQVECRKAGDVLLVKPRGEMDLKTVALLGQKVDDVLVQRNLKNLVIDLGGVAFMDSSGLGFILGRYKRIKRAGGSMCLVGGSRSIRAVLDLSGVSKLIPVHPSEDVALKNISQAPDARGGKTL